MKRLLPLALLLPALAAAAVDKPNIVILVADDMGHRDAGFMGARETRTPHLDRLAAAGAVLECHYVQPVCSPTRAALLTGRYPTRTGVYTVVRPGAPWGLPLTERTLADTLRAAGYETAISGKWHLGEFEAAYRPTRRGFDHQYGHYFGAIDYFTKKRDGVRDWHRNDQPCADDGYSTHLIAREAVRRIREKAPDKPLFLYVPFNAVHGPHQVPDSYTQAFPALQGVRRTYAGMLAAMDEAVGQVADALRETGQFDNTFLLFTSDNGGPEPGKVTDNGPPRAGKGTLHEGGVRACALACWPGRIPPGGRVSEPIHAVDWFPTLTRIAGVTLPAGLVLDGRDVAPVLREGAKSPHEALLLAGSSPAHAAVRAGDWKLIRNPPAGEARGGKPRGKAAAEGVELYNLARDPGERENLAAAEPARVKELSDRLDGLLGDAVPPGEPAAR